MKCEACDGDGLIEVGAYRGDEDDVDTRECRLCGGVVSLESRRLAQQVVDEPWETATFKDEHGQMRILREIPASKNGSAVKASEVLSQVAQAAAKAGDSIERWAAISPVAVGQSVWVAGERVINTSKKPWNAEDIAREYSQRLNEQNEREQENAERIRRQQTDALRMVKIRQLELTATCWYRSPDDDESTIRHCRGIESQELTGSWVKFKPAEGYETVTHVKICAAQQSGACVIPLSSSRSVQFGDALQVVFTEPELETIISTFVK